jgi:hypothetical protein
MVEVLDFLSDHLADSATGWSMGTFGAIAEFTRDADEAAELCRSERAISAVTARGGLRVAAHESLRLIASESPTSESWTHRVAFCLPEKSCAMSGRSELTEVGPDREALRAVDQAGVLFDLGLGTLQVDVCVRSNEPEVIAALRSCAGKSVFDPMSRAMSVILSANPHRVFISRIGRAEVYQPIPPPGGTSPTGPHTHVLPKLLAHRRTHAATEPLPAGLIPCAHCYPPHPMRDRLGRRHGFRHELHEAFQLILARCGDPTRVELKRRVIDSVTAGHKPSPIASPDDRFARATIRVALRQLRALDGQWPSLPAWLAAYDRLDNNEETIPTGAPY